METMRWAMGWSRNPTNRFVEYQAAGHGTDMFAVEKELQPQVLAWLETHLRDAPATRPTVDGGRRSDDRRGVLDRAQSAGRRGARPAAVRRGEEPRQERRAVSGGGDQSARIPLLQDGNVKDAVVVFQLNVEGYPRSANAYDSLSDGYLAMGNKEEALKYAQKAIEMLDKDPNATPEFKQLLRESAEKKIKELSAVK